MVTLTLFILHGALFLELKTDGVIRERAEHIARRFWLPVTLLAVLFVAYAAIDTDILQNINPANVLGLVVAVGGAAGHGLLHFPSALWTRLPRHRA